MAFPYTPSGLTGQPFFTAYDLASRLQIDPDSVNEDTALLLAQLASDAVRAYIRQQVDYVENDSITLYGDHSDVLLLPERPVTAVASVSLAGQELTPAQAGSTSNALMFDWRPDGSLRRITYGGSVYSGELGSLWPRGVPVQVTYSHGYQTAPTQLKSVALDLAAGEYVNPEMHASSRVGWVEFATKNVTMDLTSEQQTSLDLYRNIGLTV